MFFLEGNPLVSLHFLDEVVQRLGDLDENVLVERGTRRVLLPQMLGKEEFVFNNEGIFGGLLVLEKQRIVLGSRP